MTVETVTAVASLLVQAKLSSLTRRVAEVLGTHRKTTDLRSTDVAIVFAPIPLPRPI